MKRKESSLKNIEMPLRQIGIKHCPPICVSPQGIVKECYVNKHIKPGFSFYLLASDSSCLSFAVTPDVMYHILIITFLKTILK